VERPGLLVAGSGGLVGVMTPEGRALSKARGDGFAADSWLENDGDPVGQEAAPPDRASRGTRGA
jgi:competence protein ComEC